MIEIDRRKKNASSSYRNALVRGLENKNNTEQTPSTHQHKEQSNSNDKIISKLLGKIDMLEKRLAKEDQLIKLILNQQKQLDKITREYELIKKHNLYAKQDYFEYQEQELSMISKEPGKNTTTALTRLIE